MSVDQGEGILITGATGNVGGEVAKLLSGRPGVRAAVLDVEEARQTQGYDLEYVAFDFLKPETFDAAFRGISRMFLVRPPALSNVQRDIVPALEAAKAAGVKHIVFLSLIGVENNHVVPHYKIEQAVLESGLDWTFLRCGFFMQNLNTTHRKEIKERNEIFVPVGQAKTAFIDTRDIGAVAAKALTEPGHEGQAYPLTGSEALTYDEVAGIMTEVLDRPIRYANPSIPGFILKQRQSGTPWGFTLVVTALYTMTRFGTAKDVYPDVEHLLGRPPISLQQYVEDYRSCWVPA